jgi:predicted O-methyltransferase YrrM/precorrin-2 methylase
MSAETGFDVALAGWGTRGVEQLTVEQLRALGQARHVVVDPGAPPSIFELLRAYPAEVHDLRELYRDGRQRRDAYQAMAEAVLELARSGRTVWLTYGHPLVYSTPSRVLARECRARSLRLSILSGISSLDEIMSVLQLDIAERDLQVVFANHLVSRRRPLDPLVDLVVMQPGALGETGICRDPELRKARDVSAYRELQDHLLRFYPAQHRLTSLCLSDERGGAHEITEASLAQILDLAPGLHYGHTWFIRALDEATPAAARLDGAAGPPPATVGRITAEARSAGLLFGSDERVGALLRSLAASKPAGRLLELGTGVGLGTAWLLDGMDARARLTSVDHRDVGGIARRCLGHDPRLELVLADAADFLEGLGSCTFDLIFADAPDGKFCDLERTLQALAPGGLYVVDDMLPEARDAGRRELLEQLVAALAARPELVLTGLPWATGLAVATRRA